MRQVVVEAPHRQPKEQDGCDEPAQIGDGLLASLAGSIECAEEPLQALLDLQYGGDSQAGLPGGLGRDGALRHPLQALAKADEGFLCTGEGLIVPGQREQTAGGCGQFHVPGGDLGEPLGQVVIGDQFGQDFSPDTGADRVNGPAQYGRQAGGTVPGEGENPGCLASRGEPGGQLRQWRRYHCFS